MEFYRFVSFDGRSRALTGDRTGARLLKRPDRWDFLGPQYLGDDAPSRLGVSASDVAAHVAARAISSCRRFPHRVERTAPGGGGGRKLRGRKAA